MWWWIKNEKWHREPVRDKTQGLSRSIYLMFGMLPPPRLWWQAAWEVQFKYFCWTPGKCLQASDNVHLESAAASLRATGVVGLTESHMFLLLNREEMIERAEKAFKKTQAICLIAVSTPPLPPNKHTPWRILISHDPGWLCVVSFDWSSMETKVRECSLTLRPVTRGHRAILFMNVIIMVKWMAVN